MKLAMLFLLSLMPFTSFAQANCEKVSATVSKCSVTYTCYVTEVSNCSETIQNLTGFYKYFTYKSVCLKTTWLENAEGVLAGSFQKLVTNEGGRVTKDERACVAWKDEQKSKITPPTEVKKAVDQFLKN